MTDYEQLSSAELVERVQADPTNSELLAELLARYKNLVNFLRVIRLDGFNILHTIISGAELMQVILEEKDKIDENDAEQLRGLAEISQQTATQLMRAIDANYDALMGYAKHNKG